MWVLLVMIMTTGTNPEIVAYDQGWYTSWTECRELGKKVTEELGKSYTFTCVEWKRR